MEKDSVTLLVTKLPDGRELTITYNGRTFTAFINDQPVAENFTAQLEEGRPDPSLHMLGETDKMHWSFSVPGLGRVGLTRFQASTWLRKYQDQHRSNTPQRARRGRPSVDEDGTKEISVTLPAHIVQILDRRSQSIGLRRGTYVRNMVVAQVEHRCILEVAPGLIDNPGWQEHAIDAWVEAAEEEGFGFHVMQTMLDHNNEIAVVRRDNWANPDDATVGGREYMLTVEWPHGLDPDDYGKGTAEIIVRAAEPRRTVGRYLRAYTNQDVVAQTPVPGASLTTEGAVAAVHAARDERDKEIAAGLPPLTLEDQRAAVQTTAQDRGFEVLDSGLDSATAEIVAVSTAGHSAEEKLELLTRLDGHTVTLIYANGESHTGFLIAYEGNRFGLERGPQRADLLITPSDGITSVFDLGPDPEDTEVN
ncbi:hypothetical protein ACWFMI_23585 [Nocardiopsis terrae]|uniref:hypothetical protein n=1 Tax=Streptomyces sp. NPDC057554 TaxID=3350538 RepID=UPI0036ACFB1D